MTTAPGIICALADRSLGGEKRFRTSTVANRFGRPQLLFGKHDYPWNEGSCLARKLKIQKQLVNMAEGPSLPLHDFLDIPQTHHTTSPAASSRWTPDPGESVC
jgi:hypothetical protein